MERTEQFSGPAVARLAGISYRQLDYWARTGLLRPTLHVEGSGHPRAYEFWQVVAAAAIKHLTTVRGYQRDVVADLCAQVQRAVRRDDRDAVAHLPSSAAVDVVVYIGTVWDEIDSKLREKNEGAA